MHPTPDDIVNLQRALEGGSLQRAYRGILSYMSDLARHFKRSYSKYSVSALYQGYLDMTYFAVVTPALKRRALKIAIVFNFEAFRFEVWLSARNQGVHQGLWPLFKGSRWPQYRVVAPGKWIDSIVEYDLTECPDFTDLEKLTATIDREVSAFIRDMEVFLSGK